MRMGSSGLDKVMVKLCFNEKSFIDELSLHLAHVVHKPETDVKLAAGQLGLDRHALSLVGLLVPEDVHIDVLEVVLGLKGPRKMNGHFEVLFPTFCTKLFIVVSQ